MIDIRSSAAFKPSQYLTKLPRPRGQTNSEWLARALGSREPTGAMVLLGGVSPTAFRVRVAQSHARNDLLPSFWSHVALLRRAFGKADWDLYEASLEPTGGFGFAPSSNGVQHGLFSVYDNPDVFPNIACLQVRMRPDALRAGVALPQALEDAVNAFRRQLGFVWGAADKVNPLFKNMGVPSAVFIESVFAMIGVELTPGLASQSSCPEAIWQAAKWWHEFYQSEATLTEHPLEGRYVIGQPAAAVIEPLPSLPARRRQPR